MEQEGTASRSTLAEPTQLTDGADVSPAAAATFGPGTSKSNVRGDNPVDVDVVHRGSTVEPAVLSPHTSCAWTG